MAIWWMFWSWYWSRRSRYTHASRRIVTLLFRFASRGMFGAGIMEVWSEMTGTTFLAGGHVYKGTVLSAVTLVSEE